MARTTGSLSRAWAHTCGCPGCELRVKVEGVLGPAHRWLEGRLDLLPVQLLQEKQDGLNEWVQGPPDGARDC